MTKKENLVEKYFDFDVIDKKDGSKDLRKITCRLCNAVVYNQALKPLEDAMGPIGKVFIPMLFTGALGWAHLKKCKAWKGN